jgi:hypothetical protein
MWNSQALAHGKLRHLIHDYTQLTQVLNIAIQARRWKSLECTTWDENELIFIVIFYFLFFLISIKTNE